MNPEHRKYILDNAGKKSVSQLAAELNLKERRVRKFLENRKAEPPCPAPEVKVRIPRDKKIILLSVVIIIIAGIIAYSGSLNGRFLLDDEILVRDNAFIRSWSNIAKFFTEDIGGGVEMRTIFYRPLQMLSYAMDYSVWGLNPFGYHITNMLLHILTALCVYWFIGILFENKLISLGTAVLFVTHPVHTAAVSYIAGRAESLYLLFLLISFIFYIRSLRDPDVVTSYIVMVLGYSLALISKEHSLVFPALILLYHYAFKARIRLKGFLPIAGVTLIYLFVRLSIPSRHPYTTTISQRIPGFFAALTGYMRILFLPFDLHMEYGAGLFNFTDPRAIAGLAITTGLIFFIVKTRRSNRLVFFALSWFVIALLPVSNVFYPINAYMAENWLYMPSIGFFLVAAYFLAGLYDKKAFRAPAIFCAAALIALYSYLTIAQGNYWKDPVTFYERTVRYAPDSWRAYNNLGILYKDAGKKSEAIAAYKKAIEIRPEYPEALSNLGNIYSSVGRKDEAIALLKKAVDINPDFDKGCLGLALAYSTAGRHKEAIPLLEKYLKFKPDYAPAYLELGNAYYNLGKCEDAIRQYKRVLEMDPGSAFAYGNLGSAYYKSGRVDEAIASCKKAIEISPDFIDAYNNLAMIYANSDRVDDAIKLYEKAVEIKPDYAQGCANLALLYFNKQRYDLAVKYSDMAGGLGYKADPAFLKDIESHRSTKKK